MYESPTKTGEVPRQAIEVYKPPELRRRRRGLGLQRGGRQATGRWAEQMFGKRMFVTP